MWWTAGLLFALLAAVGITFRLFGNALDRERDERWAAYFDAEKSRMARDRFALERENRAIKAKARKPRKSPR